MKRDKRTVIWENGIGAKKATFALFAPEMAGYLKLFSSAEGPNSAGTFAPIRRR